MNADSSPGPIQVKTAGQFCGTKLNENITRCRSLSGRTHATAPGACPSHPSFEIELIPLNGEAQAGAR